MVAGWWIELTGQSYCVGFSAVVRVMQGAWPEAMAAMTAMARVVCQKNGIARSIFLFGSHRQRVGAGLCGGCAETSWFLFNTRPRLFHAWLSTMWPLKSRANQDPSIMMCTMSQIRRRARGRMRDEDAEAGVGKDCCPGRGRSDEVRRAPRTR